VRSFCERTQSFDLVFFSYWVRGRQVIIGLKNADTLSATKSLCQHVDYRSIDIVDAFPKIIQFCLCALIVRHIAPGMKSLYKSHI